MPRPKTTLTPDAIAPADLTYAVNQLIARGKTSAAEIRGLADARTKRIAELRRELAALDGVGVGLHTVPVAPKRGPGRPPKATTAAVTSQPAPKPKRKFTMTPKALAARKLQGRYIGMLNKLKGAARAKVSALAKKAGVAAAVAMAEKLLAG